MTTKIVIYLRDQRVCGRTSMWHRCTGVAGGNF